MSAGTLAGSYGKSNSFGFTLIDPLEELAREERLFVSHKKFIQETQSVTREPHRRLNAYPFINVPKTVRLGDASKGMAGSMIFFGRAL